VFEWDAGELSLAYAEEQECAHCGAEIVDAGIAGQFGPIAVGGGWEAYSLATRADGKASRFYCAGNGFGPHEPIVPMP